MSPGPSDAESVQQRAVSEQLAELVSRHGALALTDGPRVRAILADAAPHAAAEADVLAVALAAGIPARLAVASGAALEQELSAAAADLVRDHAVSRSDAEWVVRCCAAALSLARQSPAPPSATADLTDALTVRWAAHELTVPRGRIVGVGRDPDNEIVLESPVISRRHGRIQWSGDSNAWEFTDLGSTQGTFHDGTAVRRLAITGPTRLVLGQGSSPVEMTLEPPAASPDLAATYVPNAAIQPVTVTADGTTLTLSPGEQCSIGRGSDNDLQLSAPSVSRRHASIVFEAGRWQLRDLGSSAGTWLVGDRGTEFTLTGRQLFVLGDPSAGASLTTSTTGTASAADTGGEPAEPAEQADANRTVIRADLPADPPSAPQSTRRRGSRR